jgi:ATP-dependent Lhr-like helicase
MAETSDTKSTSAFQMLDRSLQEALYRMKWTQLRSIQVWAIQEILQGNDHLIITANTAGGKTEAAFLPILSRIVNRPATGIQAVYAGPLKALINDQFRRLEDLCERTEIAVHRWHGDVGQSSKKALLKEPSGILLITPESVESLFVNHPQKLQQLFGNLEFIVVDELHSFIGTERGAHLKSLIMRIMAKSQKQVRLVCLSATLGNVEMAKKWLLPRAPFTTKHIDGGYVEREIRYLIKGYLLKKAAKGDEPTDDPQSIKFAEDLFQSFYGKTALVFANSRTFLEQCADQAKRQCEARGLPDRFRIHHGSLSKAVREEAEEALKSDVPIVTFCSTTLEMGIDVGRISEIGQVNPPWSVNSLVQRLGRSGRGEGEPAIMRMFVLEKEPPDDANLFDRLFPKLLQAIAMTELLLQKWCEPPDVDRLHLSTLVQQIMSVVVERGGASAKRLYDTLVADGAFSNVSQEDFLAVLRSIGNGGLLEQAPEGALILGPEGENITSNFDFYSAFLSTEEFRVVYSGHAIGTVSAQSGLESDQYLILAGRRWKIIQVYLNNKEILVEPAAGGRLPSFEGGIGADMHARVREKMREVLFSETVPTYLDPVAKGLLQQARREAQIVNLSQHQFFNDGNDTLWFTWTSSKINRTLAALGRFYRQLHLDDEGIGLLFHGISAGDIAEAYLPFLLEIPGPQDLASHFPVKAIEKYEHYLKTDLQSKLIAKNSLDVPATITFLQSTLSNLSHID